VERISVGNYPPGGVRLLHTCVPHHSVVFRQQYQYVQQVHVSAPHADTTVELGLRYQWPVDF